MAKLVYEYLVCVLTTSCLVFNYGQIRAQWRTNKIKRADTEHLLSYGEQAGRDFSRQTLWMTDPAFRGDRRLMATGLFGFLGGIIAIAILSAITGGKV
jgi:hypothetical protein